jgi:hypothetical protein
MSLTEVLILLYFLKLNYSEKLLKHELRASEVEQVFEL